MKTQLQDITDLPHRQLVENCQQCEALNQRTGLITIIGLLANIPNAESHFLRGYEWQPWSDVIVDHGSEVGSAMLNFLDRHPVPAIRLSEGEGEAAGITYRIRDAGPPLSCPVVIRSALSFLKLM